ncbi:hypothetical protein ACIRFH_12000 [Streptomyces sp. NPDC093586]
MRDSFAGDSAYLVLGVVGLSLVILGTHLPASSRAAHARTAAPR